MSSGFTSGITKGTSVSSLYALLLSITTTPRDTATGVNLLLMSLPTATNNISRPSKESTVTSSTMCSCPCQIIACPALLALASNFSCSTGKFLSAKTFRISSPTAPVAPRIPKFIPFIRSSKYVNNL